MELETGFEMSLETDLADLIDLADLVVIAIVR
jgi:hypothetical protein